MTDKDSRKMKKFGQKVMEFPVKVGQKSKWMWRSMKKPTMSSLRKDEEVWYLSPADLKEKKKKEFFNYVDKNYKAKDESVEEEEMSDAEMKQREKIVKGLKKSKKEFEDRYGEKAMDVMYATATKMAMKDSVDYDEANAIIEKYLKRD